MRHIVKLKRDTEVLEFFGIFAAFYIAFVMSTQDGPFKFFFKLRQRFSLFDCFFCLSFWAALPVAFIVATNWLAALILSLGYAGTSTIIWILLDE